MQPPASRAEWAIEGEMRGHTVAESLRYLSDCTDWADHLAERRRRPAVDIAWWWWRLTHRRR